MDLSESVLEVLKEKRTSQYFSQLYSEVCASTCEEPILPGRKRIHREGDIPADPESYYRQELFYPFLDSMIGRIEDRFCSNQKELLQAISILDPRHLLKFLHNHPANELRYLCEFYCSDIEGIKTVENEYILFLKWASRKNFPSDGGLKSTMQHIQENNLVTAFPNIWVLLRIGLTLSVTSVSNERSFSILRRLKTWDCSAMTE